MRKRNYHKRRAVKRYKRGVRRQRKASRRMKYYTQSRGGIRL